MKISIFILASLAPGLSPALVSLSPPRSCSSLVLPHCAARSLSLFISVSFSLRSVSLSASVSVPLSYALSLSFCHALALSLSLSPPSLALFLSLASDGGTLSRSGVQYGSPPPSLGHQPLLALFPPRRPLLLLLHFLFLSYFFFLGSWSLFSILSFVITHSGGRYFFFFLFPPVSMSLHLALPLL